MKENPELINYNENLKIRKDEFEIIEIIESKKALKFDNIKIWQNKYLYEKKIDLKKFLTDDEIKILEELDILIENKIYTNYEVDLIEEKLLFYYNNSKEFLIKKNVTRKQYKKLLNIFNKIKENA